MRTALTTLLFAALVTSCGSSSDSRPAECEAIVELCHGVDQGSGPIHECHENAEGEWTKEQCVANTAMCTSACKAGGDRPADASAGN
jgi:hypothetical protein